jgi:hypothetical protein
MSQRTSERAGVHGKVEYYRSNLVYVGWVKSRYIDYVSYEVGTSMHNYIICFGYYT